MQKLGIQTDSLGKMTRDELDRLRSMQWAEADRKSMALDLNQAHFF